jgi:hypothetical protein
MQSTIQEHFPAMALEKVVATIETQRQRELLYFNQEELEQARSEKQVDPKEPFQKFRHFYNASLDTPVAVDGEKRVRKLSQESNQDDYVDSQPGLSQMNVQGLSEISEFMNSIMGPEFPDCGATQRDHLELLNLSSQARRPSEAKGKSENTNVENEVEVEEIMRRNQNLATIAKRGKLKPTKGLQF